MERVIVATCATAYWVVSETGGEVNIESVLGVEKITRFRAIDASAVRTLVA
jgi:hypothetical protein